MFLVVKRFAKNGVKTSVAGSCTRRKMILNEGKWFLMLSERVYKYITFDQLQIKILMWYVPY